MSGVDLSKIHKGDELTIRVVVTDPKPDIEGDLAGDAGAHHVTALLLHPWFAWLRPWLAPTAWVL